jgi:hypothetical protein
MRFVNGKDRRPGQLVKRRDTTGHLQIFELAAVCEQFQNKEISTFFQKHCQLHDVSGRGKTPRLRKERDKDQDMNRKGMREVRQKFRKQ